MKVPGATGDIFSVAIEKSQYHVRREKALDFSG
jgi:hypothetical protein